MYPNLIPSYPNQSQFCTPYAMPQVNAVKIDINNPQAYGGMNNQGQLNPEYPQTAVSSPYNYPYVSTYNIPQIQQYDSTGAYPIPPVNNQAQLDAIDKQIKLIDKALEEYNKKAETTKQVSTPAVAATPVVVPAPVIVPVPPVPAVPVVPQANPVVSAPVTQNVNVNPSIPAAVVDKAENTTVAPVAPVQAESKLPDGVDVNGLINGLNSADTDAQTAAIQKIAEIAQTDPAKAKALLNEQMFESLVKVINADTSKLQGPKGKPDPKNLSPLEKAEINKQFAVYTLAILQKNFRDEINKEMKKNNLPDVAINDLPYIKEGIVNNLKDNPNPTIREACLSALNYVGRPEDKEVLKTLYDISAKHDSNPAVVASAKDYLTKLPA